MRKDIPSYTCDNCGKDIPDQSKAIQSVRPDMDLHGVWMGDLQQYIWFKDEDFCSFECFIEWLNKQRSKLS